MKLIDLFEKKSDALYNKFPVREGNVGEPFFYTKPTEDNKIREDEQLTPNTISVHRDKIRLNSFEDSYRGKKFLNTQKVLQRGNIWAQTRNYREDNVSTHVEPQTHKPRHGFDVSIQSLKSKDILLGYENNGKLQGETSDTLLSSTGPVYVRLNSKGGMLNQKLSLVDIVSGNVRGRISNKINKWLEPINRIVSDARSRISDNSIDDRPEIEFNYLQQVYDANKGVLSNNQVHTYGHIYFPVDSSIGTYQDSFGDSAGFKNYQQLGVNPVNRITFVRDLFSKLESKVGGFINNVLSKIGLGEGSFLSSFCLKLETYL